MTIGGKVNQFPFDDEEDTFEKGKDLSALLELRDFIASELDPIGTQNQLDRALKPLTDGLGLDSPKEALTAPAPRTSNLATDSVKEKVERAQPALGRSAISPTISDDRSPSQALADVIDRYEDLDSGPSEDSRPPRAATQTFAASQRDQGLEVTAPPPLPSASFFRRLMAGLLDEMFVLSLFVLSFGLTLKFLTGGGSITLDTLKTMESGILIRFAALEYASLWLAYFAIGVGVLDATFGMWVWGLRLFYPKERIGAVVWRKGARILFSFIFFAPVVPVVLLAFRAKGRNLLDLLSGTSLYRTLG